jgi:hypothetical protein
LYLLSGEGYYPSPESAPVSIASLFHIDLKGDESLFGGKVRQCKGFSDRVFPRRIDESYSSN